MLEAYSDASFDNKNGIVAAGYVVHELSDNERTLVETGNRVLNANADSRDIDWCSNRAEYWATIVTLRAALEYSNQPVIVHTDCDTVADAIRDGHSVFEQYFDHAFKSFLHRYDDYYVRAIDRDENGIAHDQARLGLKIGREILRNS